ncbi:PadR family transcriptional regulator [Pantanalinema sp. GBBB05]|uniref:PadR family transcriptional regulator n=1 Tax=Pantanalinema sp. GBBB05 TaxID=2604139 RepID=UPI001D641638|nr:PadR family transcriptional regulator [Pantanalinema sp. GBBB05]
MFELATLGLLQQEPLHGYRLKQQLELFMSSCISVNYGTIYPLLKRLEERGAIVVLSEASGEAGCSRKIYSITEAGRQLWKQKMLEHPHESWVNSRSRFMIKYFFFNHLEPSERVKLLNHRLMTCQLRLENQELEPLSGDRYKALAWQRCLEVLRHEITWLTEQLATEQTATIASSTL